MISRILVAAACAAGLLGAQESAEGGRKLQVVSPLGVKFYSLPDAKGVVAAAEKNAGADSKDPGLLLKLALAHASVWEYRESVATCTRGLAVAPDSADLYTERGHREVALREFDKARADLSRAAVLDPKKVDVYYHLGLANYFLGNFAPAADAFQKAVDLAPNADTKVNATNWLYASLRRAKKEKQAAEALKRVPPEMQSGDGHTQFYFNLVRLFQGLRQESEVVPPEPPAGNTDTEAELQFDTVAYGVGNWLLYNGNAARAEDIFRRVVKGHVWVTWGFIGAETELVRMKQ